MMDDSVVSLYEKYFDDPEDLGESVGDQAHQDKVLHELVRQDGSLRELDRAIANGANVNAKDGEGNTPLHTACSCGLREVASHLLRKHGADKNAVNVNGKTPLQVAKSKAIQKLFFEDYFEQLYKCVQNDQVALMEEIISHLRENEMFEPNRPIVLLQLAAESGSTRVVLYMLDVYRVPVDASTGVRKTALHYAVQQNRYEIIRILLERGASTTVRDVFGKSPLDETTNRMTLRLISRAKALRESNLSSEKSTGNFRDYFGSSRTMVDCVFVAGFDIDTENLDRRTVLKGSSVLDIYAKSGFDRKDVDKHMVFCREAISNFIYSAQKESSATQKRMKMDYSFTERGSFVLLKRRGTSPANTSSSSKAESHLNPNDTSFDGPLLQLPLQSKKFQDIDEDVPDVIPPSILPLQGVIQVDEDYSSDDSDDETGTGVGTYGTRRRLTIESPRRGLARGTNFLNTGGTRYSTFEDRLHLSTNLFRPWFYPFVVTNENGVRSYCSVICFLQLDETEQVEGRCLCLLSQQPALSLHRDFLFDMFAVGLGYLDELEGTSTTLNQMLEAVVGREIGLPEQTVTFDIGTRVLNYFTPPIMSLPIVDEMCFDALLACISPENISTLISALFTEYPILLISEYPQLLTLCSQALLALIFPFEWYHPYVPILPEAKVDIVEAPCPFLAGIHTSYLEKISAERISTILLVNLDKDTIIAPIDSQEHLLARLASISRKQNEMPTLPKQYQDSVNAAVQSTLPSSKLRPSPALLTNVLACPGRRTSAVEDLDSSFHDDSQSPSDVDSKSWAKHPSEPGMNKFAAFKLRYQGINSQTASRAYGVPSIRSACLNVVINLIGVCGSSHFAKDEVHSFLLKQNEETQAFLVAFFATQLWASFVYEVQHGAPNQRRDFELQVFFSLLDQHLGNERLTVTDQYVYLYPDRNVSSPILAALQRSDKVTVIDQRPLPSDQIWLRFRESPGWCLSKRLSEFKRVAGDFTFLDVDRLHFNNRQLYSSDSDTAAFTHDQIFRKVRFHCGLPRFGD